MPPTRSTKPSASSSSKNAGSTSNAKSRKTIDLSSKSAANAANINKGVVKPISDFLSLFPKISPSPSPVPIPSQNVTRSAKGKEKDSPIGLTQSNSDAGYLWVDMYEPQTQDQLAVHKKKTHQVEEWLIGALGPRDGLRRYRRLLVLSGPAGSGKTATLKVFSKEMGFEIIEWKNTIGEKYVEDDDSLEYESLVTKFQTFLDRATSYESLRLGPSSSSTSKRPDQFHAQSTHIILFEDLPNILHIPTREAFHTALTAFAKAEEMPSAPIVIVISDTGLRGEAGDDDLLSSNSYGWRSRNASEVVDVRTVIPPDILKNTAYCVHIPFNPISVTLLRKALNSILDRHFSSPAGASSMRPSKEVVDMVVDSSNGDIRSAIMALQFACVINLPGKKGSNPKSKSKAAKVAAISAKGMQVINYRGVLALEAMTRREQSLALFHLLGKILYNKRYGDPEDKDDPPRDPPEPPVHLREEHSRRLSKVDTNVLYADSPVDTSLLSLYVHQNYTQYCNDVDECDGVMSWLSISDTIGEGDAWPFNASLIPHSFQLLTLGTLHALPSPVERRGQKNFKPNFFEVLKKKRDAEDGVADVRTWLENAEVADEEIKHGGGGHGGWGGQWTNNSIVCELGGVLKSLNARGAPPRTHQAFSSMQWDLRDPSMILKYAEDDEPLDRAEGLANRDPAEEEEERQQRLKALIGDKKGKDESQVSKEQHGWLSDDDIEDFGD
ncbi:Cell cycle checkpoint protein rad17 [Tulasnella sp. 419]|nr:Cell cycle checkpoint protein rad17 [Tulasnella sp. 419]